MLADLQTAVIFCLQLARMTLNTNMAFHADVIGERTPESVFQGSSVQPNLWPAAQRYCSSYHAAQIPEVFVHIPFSVTIYCQKSQSSTDRQLQKPQKTRALYICFITMLFRLTCWLGVPKQVIRKSKTVLIRLHLFTST